MDPAAIATLVADEFAWGDGDLAIRPHERLEGLLAKCGADMEFYKSLGAQSKRTKLRAMVKSASPSVRLAVVKAVLSELPERNGEPSIRTEARVRLRGWLMSQEGVVVSVTSSGQVRQVLAEYESLLREHGPDRAFDRLHSAFSAYLRGLHYKFIGPPGDKPLHKLLEAVSGALSDEQDPDGVARRVLLAVKSIANDLNTLRNKPAHGQFQKIHADFAKDLLASTFNFLFAVLGEGQST